MTAWKKGVEDPFGKKVMGTKIVKLTYCKQQPWKWQGSKNFEKKHI